MIKTICLVDVMNDQKKITLRIENTDNFDIKASDLSTPQKKLSFKILEEEDISFVIKIADLLEAINRLK